MLNDGDELIIVVATLEEVGWGVFWGGYAEPSYGIEPHPTLYPGGGGGGPSYEVFQLPLNIQCTSPDGAAVSIATKIKTTDDVYGPTPFDWKSAEYSAFVIPNGHLRSA